MSPQLLIMTIATWTCFLLLFCISTSAEVPRPCRTNTPCANSYTGEEVVPGTNCGMYYVCYQGEKQVVKACGPPLIWDSELKYCNFPSEVTCSDLDCPPSKTPTFVPTINPPTDAPSKSPVIHPTATPTQSPLHYSALNQINFKRALIERHVLVAKTAAGVPYPSIRYTFDALMLALEKMGIDGFGADFQFFLGEGDTAQYIYGLVNTAAFLANAMVESIQFDSCDENNWQEVAGKYAISNACGQEGRSYQDDECGDVFTCPVDLTMEITAITSGNQVRAPPPLKCKPGSGVGNYAGYWDTSSGTEILAVPYSNTAGRTDTEGMLTLLIDKVRF